MPHRGIVCTWGEEGGLHAPVDDTQCFSLRVSQNYFLKYSFLAPLRKNKIVVDPARAGVRYMKCGNYWKTSIKERSFWV